MDDGKVTDTGGNEDARDGTGPRDGDGPGWTGRPRDGAAGPTRDGTAGQAWDGAAWDGQAWDGDGFGAHSPAPVEPSARERSRGAKVSWGGRVAGTAVAGAAAASKVGVLAKLALLLKLKPLISFAVTAWAYALFYGWAFGVGFVVLLLLHECGHVVAVRAQGRRVSAPMFIPFVGAYVVTDDAGTVAQRAWGALAGPLAGAVAGAVCLQASTVLDSPLLRALAHVGFALNLLNLLPLSVLDGGAVARALHPGLLVVGLVVGLVVMVLAPSVVLAIVLALAAWQAWTTYRAIRRGERPEFHQVPDRTRVHLGLAYVGLGLALWYGLAHSTLSTAPIAG